MDLLIFSWTVNTITTVVVDVIKKGGNTNNNKVFGKLIIGQASLDRGRF